MDNSGLGDEFLDRTTKVQSMKEIIDKLDFIKMKNSVLQKRMKTYKQPNYNVGKKHLTKKDTPGAN